jgi:hypothetical protein
MLKLSLAAGAALMLCACGTQMGDRMASGAAIGAGVGAFTPPEDVNLGEPVWDDATADEYDNEGNPRY